MNIGNMVYDFDAVLLKSFSHSDIVNRGVNQTRVGCAVDLMWFFFLRFQREKNMSR